MGKSRQNGKKNQGRRSRRYALTAFCVALVVTLVGLCGYVVHYYIDLGRIRSNSQRYGELYSPQVTATLQPTEAPAPTATDTPTATQAPTATVAATATQAPTAAATPKPTATSTPTAELTGTPTPVPSPTILRPGADMPVAPDEPIPTPDAGTLVYALPTPPPVQSSFDALLAVNPETVGFLDIEEQLALPVVQRENDNDYYLDHTFEGDRALEGTLFMDGLNRLVPEDDCLIVYGHNMKNKTMFGQLNAYANVDYMRRHPVIHFDTLYENRAYVAFAAFAASMEPGNRSYFDVRQFIFDEAEFDKFVLKLKGRSKYAVPVDVRYGDRLLLLVTCDYVTREGRFILALRELREDETEAAAWAMAMQATAK